jgi:hypothetical protein
MTTLLTPHQSTSIISLSRAVRSGQTKHTSSATFHSFFAAAAGGIGGDGESRWLYFKKVVAKPSLSRTALQLDFAGLGNGDVCEHTPGRLSSSTA